MQRLYEIEHNISSPLVLPWPPSTNTLWRHYGNQVLISKKYREYKTLVAKYCLFYRKKYLNKKLFIEINAFPPDKRRRDLDNCLKSVLDSLQYAGVFVDDSQIDHLSIIRKPPKKGGEIKVFIKEIKEEL